MGFKGSECSGGKRDTTMVRITQQEFMRLVAWRRRGRAAVDRKDTRVRERVERPGPSRVPFRGRRHDRRLATCPGCDAVVDARILDPHSGLCPRCHEEARRR